MIRQPMASEADQYHGSRLSQAQSVELADERASKTTRSHGFGGVLSTTIHGLKWALLGSRETDTMRI